MFKPTKKSVDTARQRTNWRKLQLMNFEHHAHQKLNRL